MAISVVNSKAGSDTTGVAVASISAAAFSATTGNLIYVAVRHDSSAATTITVTDTAGNTYTQINTASLGAGDRIWGYYAKNIAGNAANVVTATFSVNAAYVGICAVEVSGLDKVSPLDTSATGVVAGSALSVTSGAFTTTAANEWLVAGASVNNLGNVFTPDTGYVINVQDASPLIAVESKIVAAIQTGVTVAMTNNVSVSWEMVVATFKAATTGASSSLPLMGVQ